MTTKSLTDCYGRRLTVENGRPGIHVHASETVGPFTSEQLRAALDEVAPAGSYTRTDEDWQARAEKAERERDEWEQIARTAERDADEAEENPRPLAPDAIESVLHDILPLSTEHLDADDIANIASDLYLAFTEPTRPEGAEELNELIGEYLDSTPGVDDKGMADFLAERGVRVVTEEQP